MFDKDCATCVEMANSEYGIEEPHEAHADYECDVCQDTYSCTACIADSPQYGGHVDDGEDAMFDSLGCKGYVCTSNQCPECLDKMAQDDRLYVGDTFQCQGCKDEEFVEQGHTIAGVPVCEACAITYFNIINAKE